jgi:hypothetical protein
MAEVVSGPLFAAMMDVQEALRKDETARRELEQLMTYLLGACGGATPPSFCAGSLASGEELQATLASMVDILQILSNDDNLTPIFQAISNVATPESDEHPGVADTTIKTLKALTGDEHDRYHVLDTILPRLVTPMDGGAGPAPIEVFIDAIADVHRIDASSQDALSADDYRAVMRSVGDFLTSETRGMEQFYFIVQHRPGQ